MHDRFPNDTDNLDGLFEEIEKARKVRNDVPPLLSPRTIPRSASLTNGVPWSHA